MWIKSLELTNYRRFDRLTIDFQPGLNVLVGTNGSGKTSILDALAACMGAYLSRLPGIYGINPTLSDLRVPPTQKPAAYMRLQCNLGDQVSWERTLLRDKTKKTARAAPPSLGLKQLHAYADELIDALNAGQPLELPILLYYGTGRGVFDVPERKRSFSKTFPRFQTYVECLDSRTRFKNLVMYFYSLEHRELQEKNARKDFLWELAELRAIRGAIERALPEISNPRSIAPAGILVDWCDNHQQTHALRIEQLSDGYRTTLAMIMDIASRMVMANPEAPDPLQSKGLVMIDEVELHLHPGWQQRILLDLTRAFPNLQFIVTTHSPQVLTTVEPSRIQIIHWPGQQAELIRPGFSLGAEAQQLLEQILGVTARPPDLEVVKQLRRYQELVHDDRWDTPEAETLRMALDDWGGEYEPELKRLDVDISLMALDR